MYSPIPIGVVVCRDSEGNMKVKGFLDVLCRRRTRRKKKKWSIRQKQACGAFLCMLLVVAIFVLQILSLQRVSSIFLFWVGNGLMDWTGREREGIELSEPEPQDPSSRSIDDLRSVIHT